MNMKIQVCTWKMCKSRFNEYITKRLNADVEKFNLKNVILETCSYENVKIDQMYYLIEKLKNMLIQLKLQKLCLKKWNQKINLILNYKNMFIYNTLTREKEGLNL